ncbi:helix-turn-helix domain-containing protein [Halorussus salinisoli]|uniref:helix-turn-helix domain-containing protein n=1 Tax=Halorussus salinisoli TaxID=2558242 RepID=UPI0010C20CED|nr:helix-turn-helix domain-containing protein [Halorussus salinisoli]
MGVATVFEIEIPASTFALAETFERAPDATVRIERTVGEASDRDTAFVWVTSVEFDRLSDLLATDQSVAEFEKLGEDGDAELYEIRFDGGICRFIEAIFDRDGVVLRASATEGVWRLQLRFADRNDVSDVFDDEFVREYEATVTRLYGPNDAPTVRADVTDKQQRALETAFESGYYEVPRSVDLEGVGERLDISRQAVSERLRRGHELLVADFLGKGEESD